MLVKSLAAADNDLRSLVKHPLISFVVRIAFDESVSCHRKIYDSLVVVSLTLASWMATHR